ncbi:MAG: hypothetical protein JWN37_675 [Candidatus Nomurabacteria bacterium]|nr:hypothetical protein [Candidatus Nomurabacteria bacterium]
MIKVSLGNLWIRNKEGLLYTIEMKIISGVYHIFDKLEDYVRGRLSLHPFVYTFIGGTGIVLFWRGIWHTADILEQSGVGWLGVIFSPMGSLILGVCVMLATGLFVSMFIGDSIIMSGLRKDKKTIDKTMDELELEKGDVQKTLTLITDMKREIEVLENEIHARHTKKKEGLNI